MQSVKTVRCNSRIEAENWKWNSFICRVAVFLLQVMVIMCIFMVIPQVVYAANTEVAIAQSDSVNTIKNNIQNAINASNTDDMITVTGSKNNADAMIELNIKPGVSVIWKAEYTGNTDGSYPLVKITNGSGKFIVTGGSIKQTGAASCITCTAADASIVVDGGTIISTVSAQCIVSNGNVNVRSGKVESSYTAIYLSGKNRTLTITGGTVKGTRSVINKNEDMKINMSGGTLEAGNSGILNEGTRCDINISGGTIKSYGNNAIYSTTPTAEVRNIKVTISGNAYLESSGDTVSIAGADARVTIEGGTIKTVAADFCSGIYLPANSTGANITIKGGTIIATGTKTCHAVCSDGENTVMEISGGTLTSNGTNGTIELRAPSVVLNIKGGTVEAAGNGNAINAAATGSKVVISGGNVRAKGDKAAIYSRNITVSGTGAVDATGGGDAIHAVGMNSSVTVSGGRITALTGIAIICDDSSSVKVSGGFVFAWGDNIVPNVVVMFSGTPNISDSGIICVWSTPAFVPTYIEGTSNNLKVSDGGTVAWGRNEGKVGIRYSRGSTSGFFPIDGITVNAVTTYEVKVTDGTGGGSYAAGVKVNIKASEAPEGKEFDRWTSEDGIIFEDETNESTSFTMPAKKVTVKAEFKAKLTAHVILVTAGEGGRAKADVLSAKYGDIISLTADPDNGYVFNSWEIDGTKIIIVNDRFVMPDGDVSVKALFKKQIENLLPDDSTDSGNEEGNPEGSGKLQPGVDGGQDNAVKKRTNVLLWILFVLLLIAAAGGGILFLMMAKKQKKEKDIAQPVPVPERFCGNCGAKLTDGIRFCTSCGAPVNQNRPS